MRQLGEMGRNWEVRQDILPMSDLQHCLKSPAKAYLTLQDNVLVFDFVIH